MDTRKLRAENFNEVVKLWSLEKFNAAFAGVYPESELKRIATEFGLKSESNSRGARKVKPDDSDVPITIADPNNE